MSNDPKLMCECLRSMGLGTGNAAADLIEQQAARIAVLEARSVEPIAWLYEHPETGARYSTLRPPEEPEVIAAVGWVVTPLAALAASEPKKD